MNFRFFFHRSILNAYVIFSVLLHKLKIKRRHYDNAILIVCDSESHMGDILLGIDSIRAIIDMCQMENRRIDILCAESNAGFLRRLLGETKNVTYYPILPNRKPHKVKELFLIKKTLKAAVPKFGYQYAVHALGPRTFIADYFVLTADAKYTCCTFSAKVSEGINLLLLRRCLMQLMYTHSDICSNELRRHRRLAELVGVKDYKAGIFSISDVKPHERTHAYATIAVDSAASARRWHLSGFAAVAQKIHEQYGLDILIVGVKVDDNAFKQAFSELLKNDWVVNLVGQTSLDELFSILKGAEFHVGVDSGHIHFSASVGTTAFCLVGGWDGHVVMPYVIDEEREGTAVPVPVYSSEFDVENKPCFWCNRRWYGYENEECLKHIDSGGICDCLDHITVDDVMNAIDKYMSEKERKNVTDENE